MFNEIFIFTIFFKYFFYPGQMMWEALGRHWYAGQVACKAFKVSYSVTFLKIKETAVSMKIGGEIKLGTKLSALNISNKRLQEFQAFDN